MTATRVTIGAEPQRFEAFADFFDGNKAVSHRVTLTIDESASPVVLRIAPPEQDDVLWSLDDLRTIPDQAAKDLMIVSRKGDPVSRLIVSDADATQILRARARNLKKRPPTTGKGKLLAWSVAAVSSVALIIFVLVPVMADQLAEFLPPSGEKALGDKTFEQIRSVMTDDFNDVIGICENAEGRAALDAMQAKLEPHVDLPYPLTVEVLDHDLINAFALPGGRVVLFRGLIDAAETPDEVAAVLAHEIGHVVNRDPARGALRSAGSIGVLGLIFGDFAGGTAVLFMVENLIQATYSQDAEAAADAFAHETLLAAGLQPSALATFFERVRDVYGESDGIVAHFQAHPKLGDRIAVARAADENSAQTGEHSLTAEEWLALKNICG